jgi:hypothetical protein
LFNITQNIIKFSIKFYLKLFRDLIWKHPNKFLSTSFHGTVTGLINITYSIHPHHLFNTFKQLFNI